MIAYEIASRAICPALWLYLGALIGLLGGAIQVLGQMAQDREVRTEAKASVRDFLEGRATLPSDLGDEVEADSRLATFSWEERPVRSSSRPGALELRLQAAHNRARPVLSRALGMEDRASFVLYTPGVERCARRPGLLLV